MARFRFGHRAPRTQKPEAISLERLDQFEQRNTVAERTESVLLGSNVTETGRGCIGYGKYTFR
jgi:hypothetical protein